MLMIIVRMVVEDGYCSEGPSAWLGNYTSALTELAGPEEDEWSRPGADTDKLYMSLGGGDMIEVGHPAPGHQAQPDPRAEGFPVLHLGPVAAGRGVSLDDQLRQEFAYKVTRLVTLMSFLHQFLIRMGSWPMTVSWTAWWTACTGTGRITTS